MTTAPMSTADAYRQIANQQRNLAAGHGLPQVRNQLIAAAERWEWLASEFEAMQTGLQAMFETTRSTTH
jgi:phytoene/squalene synthetase